MIGRTLTGLVIVLLGAFFLFNPYLLPKLFDGNPYTKTIAKTTLNNSFTFDFDKNLISKYYDFKDGKYNYVNFINVYIADFLQNTTNDLTYIRVNDCIYIPSNKSYITSVVLEQNCMNQKHQLIIFGKNGQYSIYKIEIEYFGLDYQKENLYIMTSYTVSLLIIFAGIIFAFYRL